MHAKIDESWVWARGRVLKKRKRATWADRIADHFTDVVLVLNGLRHKQFGLFRPRSDIEATIRAYDDRGIGVHLMSWIRPDPDFIGDAAYYLRVICEHNPVKSLMWDAEEPWKNGRRHAEAVSAHYAPAFADWPCSIGVTDIVYRGKSSKLAPLVEACDYVAPQAYSFPGKTNVYKPGRTQRTAHAQWQHHGKPMVMGLAAYKQGYRKAGAEAMQTCIEETAALGINRVAYWDMLATTGKPWNKHRKRVLRDLKAECER